jgi:hypothetical protein
MSRDTWGGDANRPLSLNRWGYVEGNPINLTDPTGHNPFTLGYMEGYSFGGGLGEGYFGGEEIVYDYATMTRARFTYEGTLGSPLQASAGWTVYTGLITGFGYEIGEARSKQIIDDYSGPTTGGYIGYGLKEIPHGFGVTLGVGGFTAKTSNVKGAFSYLSAGLGLLPFEFVGFESIYDIDPQSLPGDERSGVEFYADASGNVNRAKLITDILTGDHSPLPFGAFLGLNSWIGGARTGQVGIVLMAAQSFEDYHHDALYPCIIPKPPFEFPKPAPYPFP